MHDYFQVRLSYDGKMEVCNTLAKCYRELVLSNLTNFVDQGALLVKKILFFQETVDWNLDKKVKVKRPKKILRNFVIISSQLENLI